MKDYPFGNSVSAVILGWLGSLLVQDVLTYLTTDQYSGPEYALLCIVSVLWLSFTGVLIVWLLFGKGPFK